MSAPVTCCHHHDMVPYPGPMKPKDDNLKTKTVSQDNTNPSSLKTRTTGIFQNDKKENLTKILSQILSNLENSKDKGKNM